MKNIKYILLVVLVVAAGVVAWMWFKPVESKFTGMLEVVNTGCFADGECYVRVEGKHVTAIMGWSQETVGQTLGLKDGEGFGDLEKYIGEDVEVFAKKTEDGKYTLYGNENYYIKVK